MMMKIKKDADYRHAVKTLIDVISAVESIQEKLNALSKEQQKKAVYILKEAVAKVRPKHTANDAIIDGQGNHHSEGNGRYVSPDGSGAGSHESAKKSISEALEKASEDNTYQGSHEIAKASDVAVKKAAAEGIDIEGYTHIIHGDAIRHIKDKHGVGKGWRKDQIPITESDFMQIPDVLSNPDKVRGNKKGHIEYEKKMSDGTIIYVEEIRVGKKNLATRTMWKRKPPK